MQYTVSIALLLFSLFCQAQSYTLKESDVTENDCRHMYYRLESGRFADLRFAYYGRNEPVTLRVYDKSMKQISSGSVGEVEDKVFETGLSDRRQLLLGFTDDKKNVYAYAVNPADGRTKRIEQLAADGAKEAMVRTGFSPDSTRLFFIARLQQKKGVVYKGLILDKQFQITNHISVIADETDGTVEKISYVLSNDGTFSIVTTVGHAAKEPYTPLVYTVTQVSSAGKVSLGKLTGIPPGLFDKVVWQATGNELSFAGFLGTDRKSGFTSVVSGVYREQQPVAGLKIHALLEPIPYSAGLLTGHRGVNNLLTIILLEGTREYTSITGDWELPMSKYAAAAIAPEVPAPSSSNTLYYGNRTAHIVRFKTDDSVDWVRSIQKNQAETFRIIYTGLVPLFTANGGIQLFFQDARDNKQVAGTQHTRALLPGRKTEGLACVTISADGTLVKKEFLDTFIENDPSDFFFSPVGAFSDGTTKIIYTSYDYRNAGKSVYRVGSITTP
ncbi:MAG TPA: hypothetical protein VIU12_34545 [Chryseolinea sp.]